MKIFVFLAQKEKGKYDACLQMGHCNS
jgi:hypothetical protein